MFSNLINIESKDLDKVTVELYTTPSVMISHLDRFTMVIFKHQKTVEINFDDAKGFDYNIVFLCPGEIFKISNQNQGIKVVSFDEVSTLNNVLGFNHAYGNIHKLFSLTQSNFKKINIIIDDIKMLISKKQLNWNRKVFSLLENIFKISPTYLNIDNSQGLSFVHSFVQLVHKHYTMHHQISYYANLLGVKSKKLTENFNKQGLLNPHSFIKNRILIEVKRQLLYTDNSVKIICFDVGFNDPAYFSRFFKKNVGITMKQFRMKYSETI